MFGDVFNMFGTGRIGRGKVQRVGGMRVDVDCAFAMHKVSKRKDKEGDVGGFASFIDVKPSDVGVVVDIA